MPKKQTKPIKNDDAWITKNFEKLVDKYPGQYLVIAEGEPFIGYDASKLFEEARRKHPKTVPTCMPIPRPEDFVSINLHATIGFSDRLGVGFNLLGRKDIFSRFDIIFSDSSKTITFVPRVHTLPSISQV